MTREEAIKIIDCYDIGFYDLSGEKIPADKLANAFDMAIEALSAEPSGDLISRADTVKMLLSFKQSRAESVSSYDMGFVDGLSHAINIIDLVPLVYIPSINIIDLAPSAEAVQGEWVRKYDDKVNCYWYECDQCGEYRPRNQFGHEYNANFCPNCGAKMKGADNEID